MGHVFMQSETMQGITITDTDERNRLIDLRDVLDVIEPAVAGSRWRLSGVEATGDSADELHRLSDTKSIVGGAELLKLAHSALQVIDGTFEGFHEDETRPWIVVCAVDSTAFDVVTADTDVLRSIRRRFRQIQDIPDAKRKFRL